MNTTSLTQSPLTEEQLNAFKETKAAYARRARYANQLGDYPWRPGDNGFDPYRLCEVA